MFTIFCRRLVPSVLLVFCLLLSAEQVNACVGFPGCGNGPGEKGCPSLQPCNGQCISQQSLCILEPLPGSDVTSIDSAGGPLAAFYTYINGGVWEWAFMIGVAIAVLNGVIGGLQIVMSNGDTGKVDAGKTRFLSSTIGLLMLLLSGVILNFINPIGFQSSL